jgi:hypothetical protein
MRVDRSTMRKVDPENAHENQRPGPDAVPDRAVKSKPYRASDPGGPGNDAAGIPSV